MSPAWKPRTRLIPSSVTPMATRTGTFSTAPSTRISKITPSRKTYLMDSSERSLTLHFSTASIKSWLALLTSLADTLNPINLLDIMERVRVLTPVKNIILKSWRISRSYRLLRGITWVLKSPFLSRGTSTSTFPIPFRVKPRP